jgi:putative transposase
MSRLLKIKDPHGVYFITCTVVDWVDVFTRPEYKQIIIESLRFCQQNKGLYIHAYVIMTNHLHLIVSRKNDAPPLSDIVRDFKKFTAQQLLKAIQVPIESRRDWMLALFKRAGTKNANNQTYQFWIQDNHPVELFSLKFIIQKLNYIHDNPVSAGIVEAPHLYLYSSAEAYLAQHKHALLDIDILDIFNTVGVLPSFQ